MEQIKLGIIGVGNMGTTHVQNILAGKCPEIALAAVADRREARRQWAQGTVPETVQIFEEGSDLIKAACARPSSSPCPTTSTLSWPKRPLPRACTSCAKSPRASTPRPSGR